MTAEYRRICAPLACLAGAMTFLMPVWAAAATFAATGGGAIPDNNSSGVQAFFAAQGLTGEIESVSVSVSLAHPYSGDVSATLISPNGIARLKLMGRIGLRRLVGSDNSDFNGTYTFDDQATSDIWVEAQATASPIPALTYRTTTSGQAHSLVGGCSTHLDLAFGGLQAAEANGNWILLVTDAATGDLGTLNAVGTSLTITTRASTLPDVLFRTSQEDGETNNFASTPAPLVLASNTQGSCLKAANDLSGDGAADFMVLRNENGVVNWTVKHNDFTTAGVAQPGFVLGRSGDSFLVGDFDGDGLGDPAYWRAGPLGRFVIRRSSRPTDRPLEIALGTTGDLANLIADYDGDRVTDVAVFNSTNGAVLKVSQSSTGDLVTHTIPTGTGSFGMALRDANGNDKADFALQSNDGSGNGLFRIHDGLSAAQTDTFTFGLPTDLVVPGNILGNTRTDLTVVRGVAGQLEHTSRDLATGGVVPTITMGQSATDFVTPGDYDGDGVFDLAVWRPDASPGLSRFIIRKSTSLTNLEVPLGQAGHYPVNNWDVH
ncbi:MAG: proprotein convertase P-domain-containing protein [Ahniella sp.]|nr:proprotein convertase P-domain-containing protein [Ahniella sp.]